MSDIYDKLAQEAEIFLESLQSTNAVDSDTITRGLNHSYDVIAAETIDYLVKNEQLEAYIDDLLKISCKVQSYIVCGRLRIVSALIHNRDIKKNVYKQCNVNDAYFAVWDKAAEFIETGLYDNKDVLSTYARSDDLTIASLSRELLTFLNSTSIAR